MKTTLGLCSISLAAALAGCSSQPKPQPLTPQAFVAPQQSPPPSQSDNPNLGGGATGDNARPAVQIPDNQVSDTINHALGQAGSPSGRTAAPAGPRPTDVAPAAKPNSTTASRAVASPAIGTSSGQYMVLDGTVAEVNGTPIYASKLIAYIEKPLREKAKQLDRESYQRQARDLIERQRTSMIQEELAYAAAQRNLDPDDRRLADAATTMWRIKQISNAGGSLELARRASLNDPDQSMDFDEKTRLHSRTELINLYYQKKIFPRLQVTATDIRDYYSRNVDKEFTTNDQVTFRLLKVEIAKTGSKDAALAKITDKWKRAKAGEDFTAMTMRENDEKMFAGEKPFEVAPGSFAIAPVRDALVKLKVGEISEILEDRGAFYIVKIEKRIEGRVEPFEEQNVQENIRYKLKQLQFANLRAQELDKLSREAAVNVEPRMSDVAMDMAMQIYAQNARR